MEYNNLIIDTNNNLATITINRERKLNALNKETILELHNAFNELDQDKNIKVIILTGSGTKAFVAGADISEFSDFDVSQGEFLAKNGQAILFNFVENLSTPVIAAVNGFAASDNAKMGLPEVSLGVIPGYGGTQRLPKLVGKGKAMELIMTANMLSAEEAKGYGLVNYVVSQEELLPLCEKLANKIAKNSSSAIASAIKSINASNTINGFNVEVNEFGKCFGTYDFKEGTTAFLEKRKPNFE